MTRMLALSPDNRVFRQGVSVAVYTDGSTAAVTIGMCVAVYTDGSTAAVTIGMCVAGYTDSVKLRELAAGILAAADRIEKER